MADAAVEFFFGEDGLVRAIYSDELPALVDGLGEAVTRRASHVEPAAGGGWSADMGPVNGPVLGPFALRAEALAAEVSWLREHDLVGAPAAPVPLRDCTCLGSCRGAAGLGPRWRCSLAPRGGVA